MPNLFNIIEGIASNVAGQVGQALTATLGYIVNGVQKNVVNPISADVSGALGSIEGALTSLESAAANGINNTLKSVGSGIQSVVQGAETGFNDALSAVEGGLNSIAGTAARAIGSIVSGISEGFGAIEGAVGSAIRSVGASFESGIGALANVVKESYVQVFEPIAGFLQRIPQDLIDVADKIGDILKEAATFAEREAVALEKEVERHLPGWALKAMKEISRGDYYDAFKDIILAEIEGLGKLGGFEPSPAFGVALSRIGAIALAENTIGGLEEFFPGAAFIMSALINNVADRVAVGDFRELEHAGNLGFRNEVLELGELVRGRYRGEIPEEAFVHEVGKHGLSVENAEILYKSAANLLGLGDLVQLYRRGIIPDLPTLVARGNKLQYGEGEVRDALELSKQLLAAGESVEMWRRGIVPEGWQSAFDDLIAQGYTQERIDAIVKINHKLPSIFEYQDFVARKVDDEAHVAKFTLDHGIDEEYFAIAKANGYDEKTARRLYRMYWELPPFFALVQEYKAGKLGEQDFRDALSFLRFPPYWQDRFIENLKPALTQADIKEQYKFQVITADEIVPSLTAIGTPPELAESLKELWVASVKLANPNDHTANQADAAAIKGETQGLILTAYKDALISRDDALSKLKAIGKHDDAAALMIEIADYELQQQNIKDTFATLKDEYLSGSIDINEVVNRLGQAGASTQQILRYQEQLSKAGRSKPRIPTLAEFVAWHKKGIIDDAELASSISLLGYSDTWVPFYLLQAGVNPQQVRAMGYDVMVPSLSA